MELLTPIQKKPVDMALLYPTMDTNRLTYPAQCLTPEATIDSINALSDPLEIQFGTWFEFIRVAKAQ